MSRRVPRALPIAAGLAVGWTALPPVHAQDAAAGAPPFFISTSASLAETLTDNRRLSRERRGDAITEARGNVHAAFHSGRVEGFVDYGLSGMAYARESDLNDVRHSLASSLQAQLVPQHAFVDVRGSIAQRSISAFGTQSLAGTRGDGNRAETATGSISPYWVGRLGRFAEVEARYALMATNSRGTDIGDQTTHTASVRLGESLGRSLSWSLEGTHQNVDYVLGRDTVHDRVVASLGGMPDPDLFVSVYGGRESTDLVSLQRQQHNTYGVQGRWTPSERTTLTARTGRTFFGNAHSVTLAHRTPRTAWTVSDSRDLSSTGGQARVSLGTAYDLMFQQFTSLEPDPARRDVLVRNFLAAQGIDPGLDVQVGLLVSAVTLQRERSLAFTLLGQRNTMTVRLTRSETQRLTTLDTGAFALGDLATNGSVRQDAIAVNLSHRLTPTSTLDFLAGWHRSRGDVVTSATTLRTALLTWSSQPSPRTSVSATIRRADFSSPTSPYHENALLASITRRF